MVVVVVVAAALLLLLLLVVFKNNEVNEGEGSRIFGDTARYWPMDEIGECQDYRKLYTRVNIRRAPKFQIFTTSFQWY